MGRVVECYRIVCVIVCIYVFIPRDWWGVGWLVWFAFHVLFFFPPSREKKEVGFFYLLMCMVRQESRLK